MRPHLICEIDMSLKPYSTFKSSSDLRLTEQILFVNTDIQVHIVALQPELINGFFCIIIHCFFNILNVSHDLIMITFQAIRHKECVYNAEKIFF